MTAQLARAPGRGMTDTPVPSPGGRIAEGAPVEMLA